MARVGRRSLCLQRRSSTSSANPSKIMQQMERSADKNFANFGVMGNRDHRLISSIGIEEKRKGKGREKEGTERKEISYHFIRKLLEFDRINKIIQKWDRDEEEEENQKHHSTDHTLRFRTFIIVVFEGKKERRKEGKKERGKEGRRKKGERKERKVRKSEEK